MALWTNLYPNAVQDTNDLLTTVVKELVLSRTGPQYIVGDFNHPEIQLLAIMKSYGWQDIQELGFPCGIWNPVPTCRGATTIDYVLISPELVPYFQKVQSWPWFVDHLILGAEFDFPVRSEVHLAWVATTIDDTLAYG